MRIMNVNQSSKIIGGSDIYWKSLSELLIEHGHDVFEFYSQKNDIEGSKLIFPKEVDFESPKIIDLLRYCYNFDASSKIDSFINENSPQIAHLHIYYGKLTSSILRAIANRGMPIVQTLHEYKVVCPTYKMYRDDNVCYDCKDNKFHSALINKCNRRSFSRSLLSTVESYLTLLNGSQSKIDQFITVSDYQKRELVKMGMAEDRIETVHNFIDSNLFNSAPMTGEYFLYFGRIEKEKGIQVILSAADKLKNIGCKFLFVGDGNFLEEAKEIVSNRKLTNVTFYGSVERTKIPSLISRSIAVLAPSLWSETFGLVLLEAFACSKPVVASNIGGMTEIITDSIDGFLIKPGDVDELAEKLLFLFGNSESARKMGENGLKKQDTKFSRDVHYSKINRIYNTLVSKG